MPNNITSIVTLSGDESRIKASDLLVRKLIECVKVVSKTEVQIIFKGGIDTTVSVEK